MPNFEEEAQMLEWGGISFGDDFAFKLSKSIKVSSIHLNLLETCSPEWSQLT